MPGRDRTAANAACDAGRAQTLQAKRDETQVAKGYRLGLGEEAATPRQGFGQVVGEAFKHRNPRMP